MNDIDIIKGIVADFSIAKGIKVRAKQVKPRLIELCLQGQITESDFYKVSSLLSPQSRSPLWERYFIAKNRCTKVTSSSDNGDFLWDGQYYEYKASCNDDGLVHMVQIRLWQKCNYIVQVIRTEHDEIFTFKLSHEEMENEVELLKATAAHGTRTANLLNQNVELRTTFKIGGTDWERWVENYAI